MLNLNASTHYVSHIDAFCVLHQFLRNAVGGYPSETSACEEETKTDRHVDASLRHKTTLYIEGQGAERNGRTKRKMQ
jgi:hypothetical protein